MSDDLVASGPRAPKNQNKLLENKFAFRIDGLPGVDYFTKTAIVPAVSLNLVETDNPMNTINWPGTKLNYSRSLVFTFDVDEDLGNYLAILSWMEGLGFPESSEQYIDFIRNRPMKSVFSDARLLLYNNSFNLRHEVIYRHIFPIDLSELRLDTTVANPNEIVATVTFSYESFKIQKTS